MFERINNLITKKTFLGFLLCVIVFLAPVSATYIPSNDAAEQKIEGGMLVTFAQATPASAPSQTIVESVGGGFWSGLGQWLGNTLLATASMFTYIGGNFLDSSLKAFVFNMGYVINDVLGNSINDTWKIIRDFANLAFIFGFVYIGIRTIIDPESASTKRFLSKIIIGALLINFSLFFVKFIVDISNFTAYHIYNAMVSGEGSLSATVADMLGIVSIFKAPDPTQFAHLTSGGMLWFFIFGAILLLIVAFVFLAASMLIIIRFVALVLIMIGSPVLFAATIFPQTEHYASDMWKKLISYAFFAPAFLLLILISLTLVRGLGTAIAPEGSSFVTVLKSGNNASIGQTSSMGIILNFVVIIFFFIQSLLIAQKVGVAGGDAAVSMGNKLRTQGQRYLGNATFGATGAAGRATFGKVAHNWAESDGLKDAASQRGGRGWAARQVLKTSRAVGDASFDARNVNGLGNAIGAGEGRKGGYKTVLGEVEKKEKEFATSLGEVGDDDVQVEARKKEMQAKEKEVRGLEEALRVIPNDKDHLAERQEMREKIEVTKKGVEDAKIKYESEKQRRMIGSTYTQYKTPDDKDSLADYSKDIKRQEDNIKVLWNEYTKDIAGKTDDEKEASKEALRKNIKGMKEKLEKAKKEQKELLKKQPDRGYAGVLENSKFYTAWPIGRLVAHEQEAGKAIRKSAEKGLPKKKDD